MDNFRLEGVEFAAATIERYKTVDSWLQWATPRFFTGRKRQKELLTLAYEKVNGAPKATPPVAKTEDKK